jgi:hypothetical protein
MGIDDVLKKGDQKKKVPDDPRLSVYQLSLA